MVKVMPDEVVKSIDKDLDWWKYVELKKVDGDKVLVIDTNIGLDHALGLGRQGVETYYAVVHSEAFPRAEDEICGYGFNEIIKVWDWGEGLENGANVIVFTDSGFGALADWLRSKGYYVFGADAVSERLELDRRYVRRVLSKLGVKIPSAKELKGISAVVDYIGKVGGKKFVKISRFRGDVETFGTDDPKEAEFLLKQGALALFGDEVWFVVEDSLEGMVEIGVDTWFNGREFQPVVAETIEIKGAGNVTKFVRYEDSVWYDVLEKLRPYLARNGYRGMFCLEGFYDGKDIYITDITPRFPYICSHAYPRLINNYAELIIGTAKGEDVEAKVKSKYSAQIGVYTDMPDRYRVIRFDEKYKDWIAFRRVMKKDGKVWFVPGDYVVAVGISAENNWKDAILRATEIAETVSMPSIYTQGREFLNEVDKVVSKLSEFGYEY